MRIAVYNIDGSLAYELSEAMIDTLEWSVDHDIGGGAATLSIPVAAGSSVRYEPAMMAGRILYIDPENGLPPFAGLFSQYEYSSHDSTIRLSCAGIESALQYTGTTSYWTKNGRLSDVVQQLLSLIPADGYPVVAGYIQPGGPVQSGQLPPASLYDILTTGLELGDYEWRLRPQLNSLNQLELVLDMAPVLGTYYGNQVSLRNGVALVEMTMQADLSSWSNMVVVTGSGADRITKRPVATVENVTGGRRIRYVDQSSARFMTEVQAAARREFQASSKIRINATVQVTDRRVLATGTGGTYEFIRIGDWLNPQIDGLPDIMRIVWTGWQVQDDILVINLREEDMADAV